MICGSEDEIVSIINSGKIKFKRLSHGDKHMPTSEQLYVRVTYRSRDQVVKDLYLKGQLLVWRSKDPVFQTAKTLHTSPSPSPPVHETSSTEQPVAVQEPVVHQPLLLTNSTSGSTEDKRNERNIFEKTPSTQKQFHNQNLRQHTGDKSYKCSKCDKTFLRKRYLKMHTETVHSVTYNLESPYHLRPHNREKTYKCNICIKVLTNKVDLKLHMTDHTKQSSYTCTKCQKTFSNNEDFMLHMYIHTGKKPYPCSQCNKSFLQKSDLKKHLETHMGQHSLKINQRSLDKASMDKHIVEELMVSHSGERPYQCKLGDNIFLTNSNLEDNINAHTEGTTYQCNDCGKDFHQSSILNGDLGIKIEDNLGRCNQCHMSLSQDRSVINHTIIQTLEMVEPPNNIDSIDVKQEEMSTENSLTHKEVWETLVEAGLI